MGEIRISKMEVDDIEQVMKVEVASHHTPWSEDIFYQEIVNNDHAHYFKIMLKSEVIGYAGVWVVLQDAQITNIAITPAFRGQKFGEKLFRYLLQYVTGLGVKNLSLEVRASNIIAQRMYRKFGLVPGGIRKSYYTDNQEDAIVMWVKF